MTVNSPLLSIITVVFNGKEAIENTVKSISRLKSSQVEYIIIDGGSTDGTLLELEKYSSSIDIIVSEPDKGIYDAMNKGWNLAKGKYILHINIGDELIRLPVEELHQAIKMDLDVLSFPVLLSSRGIFNPTVGTTLKINNTLHHQGTLYNRNLPERYNLKYRVFADFDLNQRLYKQGKKIKTFSKEISKHDTGGISNSKKYFNEVFDIIESNFGSWYKTLAFFNFKLLGLKGWIEKK